MSTIQSTTCLIEKYDDSKIISKEMRSHTEYHEINTNVCFGNNILHVLKHVTS